GNGELRVRPRTARGARRSRPGGAPHVCRLGAIVIVLVAWAATPVRAEVAGSLAIDSDYQLRGVSLSDNEPVASVTLSYDHGSGAYGDIAAIGVATRRTGVEFLGYVAHLGYARRLPSGASLDVGVANSRITTYVHRRYSYDYTEVYVGLSKGDLSAHVYLSPDYIGEAGPTAYVELEGALRPARHWRVFGHIGLLAPLRESSGPDERRARLDLRAGIARELGNLELHVVGTTTSTAPYYPPGYLQKRTALTVGAVYFF
ncbi:MAG TPA: TorF family putative porin, partial [Caulobacteraceae bacterium]|nr:TorF family putative porin [Caulobacteraceae bacterium]